MTTVVMIRWATSHKEWYHEVSDTIVSSGAQLSRETALCFIYNLAGSQRLIVNQFNYSIWLEANATTASWLEACSLAGGIWHAAYRVVMRVVAVPPRVSMPHLDSASCIVVASKAFVPHPSNTRLLFICFFGSPKGVEEHVDRPSDIANRRCPTAVPRCAKVCPFGMPTAKLRMQWAVEQKHFSGFLIVHCV